MNILNYTGDRIADTLTDERMRNIFLANRDLMRANYKETVDAALVDHQIRLCAETREYLYRAPGPVRYQQGTRPRLEQYARQATAGCHTDFDRAIALMDHLKLLYQKCNGRILFYGGTEEELLQKGEQLCECLSRLQCALCEVLGIPARIITHCYGGHVTTEIFTDGKWWYLDPRAGLYMLGKDGKPASLWELWQDPALLSRQPEAVKHHVSPRYTWEQRAKRLKHAMLSELEVNTVKYYSLADAGQYSYRWIMEDELLDLNRFCDRYDAAEYALDGITYERPSPSILFSVQEGQLLHDRIMICATCQNFCIYPREIIFSVDGSEVWRSPGLVPLSDLHHPSSAIYTLGGSGHCFDTRTLSNGIHTLTASCRYSSQEIVTGSVTFTVQNT